MPFAKRYSLFAAAAIFAISSAALAATTFINILTGGTSGVYYPIGVACRGSTVTPLKARKLRCKPPGFGGKPQSAASWSG